MASCIKDLQRAISAPENYPYPVVAAISGFCVGGGVDLAAACDIRFADSRSSFSIKEVDVGIAADLGSLQRLPGIIGEGRTRELALSCRTFHGTQAEAYGFCTRACDGPMATLEAATECALTLAAKSPVAIVGTKAALLQQRRASLHEGLHAIAWRNAATLASSHDVEECLRARAEKRRPVFSKL
jgi:delta(3,5)-delta(2,4)-dienoyl-CoA isomerase